MRVEIRFWETIERAATPVNSGYLGGGAWLIPGPLPHNVFTFTAVLPPGSHIAPSDPDIAIQIDYRDNATNGLAYGTVVFSNGNGTGPQVGTSQNLYFRDVDGNGIFDPTDARQLAAPNLANFWLVLGGEYPTVEAEPNDTQGSATVTAPCFTLGAAISPAGDVDWFKFTLTAPQALVMQVECDGPSDDSTLTLRDGLGAIVAFNDNTSPTDLCSRITRNLAAGVYYLEVHENGDDDEIPGYQLRMGSGAVAVANLRWTDTSTQQWDPLPGGGSYDRIHGDLQILASSGLAASVVSCLDENLAVPTAGDARTPAAGQGFWYLVRGTDPCTGGPATYDEGGNQAAPRDPLIPPPPVDCGP